MALENRRGLGRGLSALLGESEASASGGASARDIPIELIRPNPAQPRTEFPEAELEELAASIRNKGLLQPILVRPAPGAPSEYQIVAGERRWRAAQRAGLQAIPAVVRELCDIETLEAALIENLQRSDLGPLEEAMAYTALMASARPPRKRWPRLWARAAAMSPTPCVCCNSRRRCRPCCGRGS